MGKFLPTSNLRKTTARLMEEAIKIPTATLWKKVDASKIVFKERRGYKLDAILLYTLVETALKMPEVNVSWELEDGEKRGIWQHDDLNLGMSVNTKDNDVVLVAVKGGDLRNQTPSWFDKQAAAIRKKAETGKFPPEDFFPHPIVVLNDLSSNDADGFVPILPPGATLMITTSRIKKEGVILHNEFVVRPMMNVTLTFDHRPIDGVMAAKFLALFKNKLEHFQYPRQARNSLLNSEKEVGE